MYTEISTYGKNFSETEIIDTAFKVVEHNIDGLNVSSNYLSKISSIISSDIILSCPIDYPYGLKDTQNRQHETISAIRRGANCVDLVINPIYIVNSKTDILIKDIKAHQNICKDNNILLRVMLEYRHFENQIYYDTIQLCKMLKLKYIFPSTAHFADDYNDNLIMCKMINSQYPSAKIICNGNIWKIEQYDFVKRSGIYGIRLRANYDFSFLYQ